MIVSRVTIRHPGRTGDQAGTCRAGLTLVELLVVLAIIAAIAAVAVRSVGARLAQLAVAGARAEVVAALARAREEALASGSAAARFDSAAAVITVQARGTVLARRELGARFGVALEATRDSLAYDARGLGRGAANLRLVLRRGAASETVVVSRLGRVR